MIDTLVENSLVIIIGILATAGFGGIAGYFKKRTNCLQKVADDMEDMKKRAYRIEKALIILTKMQDDAIEKLTQATQRARAGLKNPNKPIGSFMFLVPT